MLQGESARTSERIQRTNQFEYPPAATLTRNEVIACIEDTGVIPFLSEASAGEALFIAEALVDAGVPILQISTNDADAVDAITHLAKHAATTIVGAGSIRNVDTARKCVKAGAKFLATDGAIPGIVEFAAIENIVTIVGALTLTEIMSAWDAGADFVKVVPCHAVGGHKYVQTVKVSLPSARIVAEGGVNQLTALNYAMAGAAALSVGAELIPPEAVALRQVRRIQELARRFLVAVDKGRD